jgi:hypothetical protein
MALTANTVLDIVGLTQTITFSNPTQIDQISFTGGQITFQTASSYDLLKSDLLLYVQYINAYNLLLFRNFPLINANVNAAFPLSLFEIYSTNVGTTKLFYNQTSGSNTVLNIDYLPIAGTAVFAIRNSPVTITLQEFFMTVNLLTQYAVQVNLN